MNSTAWTLYSFVWITLLIIKSMNPEASHVTNSDKSNKFTRIKIAKKREREKKRANKRRGRFLEGRIWFIINLCWSLSVQAPFSNCRSSNHDKSHMKWSKNGKKNDLLKHLDSRFLNLLDPRKMFTMRKCQTNEIPERVSITRFNEMDIRVHTTARHSFPIAQPNWTVCNHIPYGMPDTKYLYINIWINRLIEMQHSSRLFTFGLDSH